jgi:hypothetical protein
MVRACEADFSDAPDSASVCSRTAVSIDCTRVASKAETRSSPSAWRRSVVSTCVARSVTWSDTVPSSEVWSCSAFWVSEIRVAARSEASVRARACSRRLMAIVVAFTSCASAG